MKGMKKAVNLSSLHEDRLTCKVEASVISTSVPTENGKPLVSPALFLRWALLTGTLGPDCLGANPGPETY